MRTAVVRVDVDPTGLLTVEQCSTGMQRLAEFAGDVGVSVVQMDLAAMPPSRRELQLLVAAETREEVAAVAVALCAGAFGTEPVAGVVTYVSRGTDDDAHGVLAAFGLTADIQRVPDADGLDVVHVTLSKKDLERVPESRIHTALEASLNAEVRISTR
jgi:hypothetical protein